MNPQNKSLKEEFLKLKNEVEPYIQNGRVKDKSHLQSYLYFAYYPLFSFVESILILCESGKFRSAESLLRSLIELHINVIYYQVADSDRRLAISVKKDLEEKITGIRGIRELIRKYPNLKSDNPKDLFSNEWLKEAEDWAEERRQAILRGNHLIKADNDLSLKDKAIKCDQAKMKDIEAGHFERMYHMIYRQLSPSTHLNIGGIQGFVDQKEGGNYLFSDGGQKDYYLMQEAIAICVALTKDLYENGVIVAKLPDTIGRLEKLLTRNLR
ncbi:MAG: DUF5677 domain-containing protein [Candidatus Parcubacteria bacterium]|nr:DUF5677 domain-containing protein [Candidatus Parcubacteria bacterium]